MGTGITCERCRHVHLYPRKLPCRDCDGIKHFQPRDESTVASTPTSPSYYSRFKIQPLDFIVANKLDFLTGNIIKYVMRYDAKNGLEDLQKAMVYLEQLIQQVKEKETNA